jgi:hypothetical protein
MTMQITNAQTGERETLSRDVCAEHPEWVHDQCGTESEGELQAMLDQYDVRYYYDSDGEHKGPDILGIEMVLEPSEYASYGYDGDPSENSLMVEVKRDGETGVARA